MKHQIKKKAKQVEKQVIKTINTEESERANSYDSNMRRES